MGLLEKLKSLLGRDDDRSHRRERGGVTVERSAEDGTDTDPSGGGPGTTAEAKGATTAGAKGATTADAEPDPSIDGEPESATDRTGAEDIDTETDDTDGGVTTEDDTEGEIDDAEDDADDDTEAETEADIDDAEDDTEADIDDAEDDADDDTEAETEADMDDADDDSKVDADDDEDNDHGGAAEADAKIDDTTVDGVEGEPTTEIKGIGPAYADRLADAGVETVEELAAADAAALAEAADISETRLQGWIDRAKVR